MEQLKAYLTTRASTLFLRATVLLIGVAVLALCAYMLPVFTDDDIADHRPLAIGMYMAAVPFYIALFQTMKLLHLIDTNKAFSTRSIRALGYIKYCAVAIAALYVVATPFLYPIAEEEDAPGVLLFGMIIAFASIVVATFAAVLQKLLQNAIAIKSENDLTV